MAEVQIINKVEGRIDRSRGAVIDGPIKVAAYARVSTDMEDQRNSYQSQLQYYTEKMKSNPKWIPTKVYADEGISGTQDYKRNDFMQMIEDALKGKFDLLLTKSISRFARNTVDTLNYVRKLKEKNVAVYFEEENINTLDMQGELLLTILSSVAQQESETISSHVKLGLAMKMKRGELVGFHGCYGYNYDKLTKTITVNDEEKRVIQFIFEKFIQGYGTSMIARELNEMGIPTKRGNTIWYENTVRKILKNEKYKGDLLQGKTYTANPITHRRLENMGEEQKYLVKNNHEAIIDEETWNRVQEIFEEGSIKNRGERNIGPFKRFYAFSGITFCAFCGRPATRKDWSSTLKDKKAWCCTTVVKQGRKDCNYGKSIPEEMLEKCFLDAFNVLCADKATIIRNFIEKTEPILKESNATTEIEKLNIKEHDLKEKLKKLLDLKLENSITEEAFKEKNYELERKIKNIRKQREERENNLNNDNAVKDRIVEIKEFLKNSQLITKFDKEIFKLLIDKVIIGEIDKNGNADPYVISFVLKTSNNYGFDNNEDKQIKKKPIKQIDINEKNIICELKSFQKMEIYVRDKNNYLFKKKLDFIKVKIVADYDGDITTNIEND